MLKKIVKPVALFLVVCLFLYFSLVGCSTKDTASQDSVDVPDDGVSYWSFDENSGATVADVWGSNDGTLTGTSWTEGKKDDSALAFNGTDSFVSVGATDMPVPWTIAMWVKKSESTSKSNALISSEYCSIKVNQYPETGKVGYTLFDVDDYTFEYSLPVDTWVHLVFAGTDEGVKLYVDGKYRETNPAVIECPLDVIGCTKNGEYFTGSIDEVKIFSRALSDSEIASLTE